ncbi:MAG: electron transfer flavoprotein-ubiquinone oxidoreductase [Proteobacteria bacterium]|nr:electron transfer flavoprotein-ubiquinone oxidoreductase [Pseudomonadota bacterium]
MDVERETLSLDVLFVGAGPACLAGAIHLAGLSRAAGLDLEIGLIEKGAAPGAHCISGALVEPGPLASLFGDLEAAGCPIQGTVRTDRMLALTPRSAFRLPWVPPFLDNRGCLVVSLSRLAAWMGEKAEEAGVNLFCGFAGQEVLFSLDGRGVAGVRTGDRGLDASGNPKARFEPGTDILARVTVFGEGARGNLLAQVDRKLSLFAGREPQAFEVGVKQVLEVAETSPLAGEPGTVIHTLGFPLGREVAGGGFLYPMGQGLVSAGLVGTLNRHPGFDPHEAFEAFLAHPYIERLLAGGRVVEHGARTLSVGGPRTMPRLAVDGALFVGDSASMLDPRRLKGVGGAVISGVLAARAAFRAMVLGNAGEEILSTYKKELVKNPLFSYLWRARNFHQALARPGLARWAYLAAQEASGGRGFRDPLPGRNRPAPRQKVGKIPPDARKMQTGIARGGQNLYVDKRTGVFLSGTRQEEDQPCHLIIHEKSLCLGRCTREYRNPCLRFCPAGVYEIEEDSAGTRRLKLNPSNCLHCKTCEIQDPYGNIRWTCPEGGGGPGYRMA